jgi:hypothetical protein
MSVFTRGRALAVLAPVAVAAASLFAAPAAQAATIKPLTTWVNCSAATEGQSGNQWYVQIACSPVQATSWELAVQCSDGSWHYSGFFTTFENVSEYCPAGTTPTNAVIYYTT